MVHHKRVLLKISGEALGETSSGSPFAAEFLEDLAQVLLKAQRAGQELAIVVGGGNFFRGARNVLSHQLERSRADGMGMLATAINGLALQGFIQKAGGEALLQSALPIPGLLEGFHLEGACQALSSGKIVIFVGGLGCPFFSTDTAAALRALEIKAEVFLKASNVAGVYTADPKLDPQAQLYSAVSFEEALRKHLKVMDQTAMALCREHNLPVVVFAIKPLENLSAVLRGGALGTRITHNKGNALAGS